MSVVNCNEKLIDFCKGASKAPYIAIDTEFMRDRTYFAKLCSIQVAYKFENKKRAILIDTLANNLDLKPLFKLFQNQKIVKVFHAARQDIEIFYNKVNIFPEPFFDTQIAAMVCGFGDQVGYETLTKKLVDVTIDKSSRFTDWTQRPLSKKQIDYAISDVTYLCDLYEKLNTSLLRSKRERWVKEELEHLINPETYDIKPENAWKKIKIRNVSAKALLAIRSLAEFREDEAQKRDIPRGRIFKDDSLLELAQNFPLLKSDFKRLRSYSYNSKPPWINEGIIKTLSNLKNKPQIEVEQPRILKKNNSLRNTTTGELIKLLLKAKCEEYGVAPKLIASASEIEAIAYEENPDVPALKGWRWDVFGQDALELKAGRIAISNGSSGIILIKL